MQDKTDSSKIPVALIALILVALLVLLCSLVIPKMESQHLKQNATERVKNTVHSKTEATKDKETTKKETKEKPKISNNNIITKAIAKDFYEDSLKLKENQIAISFKNGDYWIIDCYENYFESQANPISLSYEMNLNSYPIDLNNYIYGFISQQIGQNDNFSILEDFSGWKKVKASKYSELTSSFVLISPSISEFRNNDTVKHFRFKTKNKGRYYYFSLCL